MSLKDDLKAAQAELDALEGELPNFERLLAHNEREVQALRERRASPEEQVAARSRVMVAKELLEQHHADIATAKARVEELKQALQGEADRRL